MTTESVWRNNNKLTVVIGLILSISLVPHVSAKDPASLPGMVTNRSSSIDLDHWKVTLPVNKSGQTSGKRDAVEFRRLKGLAVPSYFDVKPGSITFVAPTNGALTKDSEYPRSELREMDGNGNLYEWLASDGGRFSATLRVDELPVAFGENAVSRIIIGQIQGKAHELCRLYYDEKGQVYFVDDKAGPKQEQTLFKLRAADGSQAMIPLGARFSYYIEADAERLVVTVTYNGVRYEATDMLSSFWLNKPVYFKAGVYSQVGRQGTQANTVGTGQGKATFFEIAKPTHGVTR